MNRPQKIKSNLTQIKEDIGDKVQLIAVSKYYTEDEVLAAFKCGQRDFGESKVPSLRDKVAGLEKLMNKEDLDKICWHFIGNLQKNKINNLFKIPGLKSIHSVDSLSLLQALYSKQDRCKTEHLNIFLQVNTSSEVEKSGFDSLEELKQAIQFVIDQKASKFNLCGLMTIGKIRTNDFEKDARSCFDSLRELKVRLENNFPGLSLKLSMGMSQDYKLAVECGSDCVRIGSLLFE
ncbi:MAG: YggS family pyridoxal phosphate-dependent enzyme [Bacteriovoracaceae bacterium]|nr:YggS family pyridoxal phosphate-dependent enzyme [Bacteriovoracaceae bacterium]